MTIYHKMDENYGWRVVQFFAYGLVLAIISDVPITWGVYFYLARLALAGLLLSTIFMPLRHGLLLLLILSIVGQDIVSSGILIADDDFGYATASIWQLKWGFINPSWIIFTCLFVQLLRIGKLTNPPLLKRAIFWFATVPVFTGIIYGILYGGFSRSFITYTGIEAVTDIKFSVMLIASTILFLSIFKKSPSFLIQALAAFVGVLLARHLLDLFYVVMNIGPAIAEGVTRGSEDSAKGAVAFLALWGIIMIWRQKRLLLGMAVTIPSVLLIVAYGTRNLWITFVLGFVVLLLILGIRRSFSVILIAATLTFASIWTLSKVNPDTLYVVGLRFVDIGQGRPIDKFAMLVEDNIISRVDQVRYAEIINVMDSIRKRYAYLWGVGYGGYYDDTVLPYPVNLKSSYPKYSLESGRFYRAHEYIFQMILKFGLVGLVLISTLWVIPGYIMYKIFRRENMFAPGQPLMLHGLMLGLVAFLPTAIFQMTWSGKGLFLNGLVIATCIEFARHYSIGRQP